MTNPVKITYQLDTADSDGLAQAQSLAGAGSLTLNGVLVSGGVGELDTARRVLITSVGNDSALTWTVTGTDRNGNSQTEDVAGASGAGVYTDLDFLTVTDISADGATAGNVTAGTNGVGSTQWFVKEWMDAGTVGVLLYFDGTANASVELTWDDPNVSLDRSPYQASPEPQSDSPPKAVAHPLFDGVAATTMGVIDIPHFAYRLTINSGTDPVTMQTIEQTWLRG